VEREGEEREGGRERAQYYSSSKPKLCHFLGELYAIYADINGDLNIMSISRSTLAMKRNWNTGKKKGIHNFIGCRHWLFTCCMLLGSKFILLN